MCLGGGGKGDGGAAAAAAQAAAREKERQARISQGTQSINEQFAKFTPEFYTQRADSYKAYAAPQLESQYEDAKRNMIYALSRSGLLNSTTAANRQRALTEQYGQYQTELASKGQNLAARTRQDVENARGDLLSQLIASEDPSLAAQNAGRQAEFLSSQPAYDPVGNYVFNATEGLADLARRRGALLSPNNNSLLVSSGGSGSGSSTVTRA